MIVVAKPTFEFHGILTAKNFLGLINYFVHKHCNPHALVFRLGLQLGISVQFHVTCHSMLKQAVLDKLECHPKYWMFSRQMISLMRFGRQRGEQ